MPETKPLLDNTMLLAVQTAKHECGVCSPEAKAVRHDAVKANVIDAFAHDWHVGKRWIQFVDTLPKTATGKIQRYKLREMGAEIRKSHPKQG